MSIKNSVLPLTGKVQHYQWGGFDYIPALIGVSNSDHQPFAEYWLGAHDSAPAKFINGQMLNKFLEEHHDLLGEKVDAQFGRLPYLLKILDVKDMLSIQVHPSKKAAVEEFKKENERGVAADAPNRNYKDDNHKPELMMALGDFWLLHGFLVAEKLIASIKSVPEFNFMIPLFGQDNYKNLYEKLMTMEQEEVIKVLQPVLDRIIPLYKSNSLAKDTANFWAARAALTFNAADRIDRGIFSIYLFNILFVKKGQAVFQDAGILHAYLEGQNVEIMANSDNVLRGGLTPKHIDVNELIKHVRFEPVVPNIITPTANGPAEQVFKTPAPDFELSKITLAAGESTTVVSASVSIFLVLDGEVEIAATKFDKGKSFLAGDGGTFVIKANSAAEIYKAGVPV